MVYLTGFADEASANIDEQISVTKELNWSNIEARNIGKKNIHDLDEEEFSQVVDKLGEAGVSINCFGSTIANWAKSVNDDFQITLDEVKRSIPKMKILGTKMIRIMSYARLEGNDQKAKERFYRLNEITKRFLDEGITPVHENCMNYGGLSWKHTLEIIENVPGLRLVYDTGNPAFNKDYSSDENPLPYQNGFEFYSKVKEFISYIHIKDAYMDKATEKEVYTFPGEGNGYVKEILQDLKESNYQGGISIEPHLAAVFHDPDAVNTAKDKSKELYLEYGKRIMKILNNIGYKYQ